MSLDYYVQYVVIAAIMILLTGLYYWVKPVTLHWALALGIVADSVVKRQRNISNAFTNKFSISSAIMRKIEFQDPEQLWKQNLTPW